ncbi:MAG: type II toxin-antitoxin system RelE/ParE family toxin [Terracidiphilus sp.]|jgi:toxin ParE1/3/4
MQKVSFRPLARKDLREVAAYLLIEASEAVAVRFEKAVQNATHTLAGMPGIGVPCSFRNPELHDMRRLTVKGFENWLLFYRDTEDRIDVIRVLHGARDIAAVFEEDT